MVHPVAPHSREDVFGIGHRAGGSRARDVAFLRRIACQPLEGLFGLGHGVIGFRHGWEEGLRPL
jgi:hypothetical protein